MLESSSRCMLWNWKVLMIISFVGCMILCFWVLM